MYCALGRKEEGGEGHSNGAEVSKQLGMESFQLCSNSVTPGIGIIFVVQKKGSSRGKKLYGFEM